MRILLFSGSIFQTVFGKSTLTSQGDTDNDPWTTPPNGIQEALHPSLVLFFS